MANALTIAASLADNLGKWLAIAILVAAFALASRKVLLHPGSIRRS